MKRSSRARPIATVDCETDPFLHGRLPQPFLWDIFDGAKHYTYEHVCDVIDFLKDKKWIVYAHNGGKFDYHMQGFLSELEPWGPIMLINGRLAQFKIGECEFRDSYNILPVPLAQYKKDDIDYAKFERKVRASHMGEITRYLHGDTAYLYELVSKFRADYGPGLTLAGSAMKVWAAKSSIKPPKSSRGFYDAISPYYYGGRVECFHFGEIQERFKMVDINSAYPYAMLHKHPFSTTYDIAIPLASDPIKPESLYAVRALSHGAFPFRNKTGLEFPHDAIVRDYFVSGWELQAALDTQTVEIIEIKQRMDFHQLLDFTPYINHFYELKKASKKESAEYIFAKLFMNSLYGKFGANPDNYNNYTVCDPAFISAALTDGYEFAGELGPWAVMQSALEESQIRYYNAATAASITGFVRAYLWRHVCAIRKAGGEVLYCDTDSLAFTGEVPSSMRMDKELGGWSLEGEFDRGGIGGKKMYAFHNVNGKWKCGCKGVKLTPGEIIKVCQGETVTYKRDAPSYGHGKKPSFLTRRVQMTGRK